MLKNKILKEKQNFSPHNTYVRMTASNQAIKSNVITYFAHKKLWRLSNLLTLYFRFL